MQLLSANNRFLHLEVLISRCTTDLGMFTAQGQAEFFEYMGSIHGFEEAGGGGDICESLEYG